MLMTWEGKIRVMGEIESGEMLDVKKNISSFFKTQIFLEIIVCLLSNMLQIMCVYCLYSVFLHAILKLNSSKKKLEI